ncbi:LysR family transcriptional regulator [Pseudomonas matsuisoli]|uniref:Transcriptional regulator n=1 Tax=Pseudomonas matsuisoli TaxID=1515666 RepID=A0A917Q4Y3_9PSED|nr:LysR family transcriptional regulator [Pseudomonas matsuisoli]GGK09337.1 transcriptional regulator [Pseudomonas matsuisoli]
MRWNLDQLEAFVAVHEQGSFSAAARRLGRVQSAVSQSVAMLEADLALLLFERSGGRTPKLTDAGRTLLAEARTVLLQCDRLQGRADGLQRGEEAVLRLAQDEAMPYQPVIASLEGLEQAYPNVEVHLTSGAQGDVARKLLERRADLGLLFHHGDMPAALERRRLGTIEMVTVCSVNHPLAPMGTLDRRTLGAHRQLLMTPGEVRYAGDEQLSPSVWRTDSFYTMAELLMRGLGWAWLPKHVAQYPMYLGHLIELQTDWTPPSLVVELVHRRDEMPGPAARYLGTALAKHLSVIG